MSFCDVLITPLDRIKVSGGDVLKAIKVDELSPKGFGEAYFSFIEFHKVKAWKLHTRQTSNLIVPIGKVGFVCYSESKGFYEAIVESTTPCRLTIPPNVWFGFKGLGTHNLILNIADIVHDPREGLKCDISELEYEWNKLS